VLLAVDDHHCFAVVVLLVFGYTELVHQRIDPVLAWPDPRAAAIDPQPVVASYGERATADPVTRLQQRYRAPRLFQPQRGGQACESRSNDAIVEIRHDWLLS
jgi:hypothetical protein